MLPQGFSEFVRSRGKVFIPCQFFGKNNASYYLKLMHKLQENDKIFEKGLSA